MGQVAQVDAYGVRVNGFCLVDEHGDQRSETRVLGQRREVAVGRAPAALDG